jgi:CRP-like cAMP-binding protein
MAVRERERFADLRQVQIFASVGDRELEQLASTLVLRRYAKDSNIFFHGDHGSYLCIVKSGLVKLSLSSPEGREVILDLFAAGESFGELALFDGEPRSTDAVAVEPTQLLLLGRDDFLHFLDAQPKVAISLLVDLAQRLRRDAQLVGDGVFLSVSGRLARTILRLSTPDASGRLATAPLRQDDLAGMAGTTRETLNKWLGIYESQGLIQRRGRTVEILDKDGLSRRIA